MSNLVTPMLTSVDNSSIVDFYPSTICFSNSTCGIINASKDRLSVHDTGEWNDLEKLVNCSSKFIVTTTKERPSGTKKNILNPNLFSNEAAQFFESGPRKQSVEKNISDNLRLVTHTDSSDSNKYHDILWNAPNSENNSCSKACVNINMGYHEGSSMESVISNVKIKEKSNFPLSRHPVSENVGTKSPEVKSNVQKSELHPTQSIVGTTSPISYRNLEHVRAIKNSSKAGHSRLWGSCGSAGTLALNYDNKNSIGKQVMLESKHRSQSNVCEDINLSSTDSEIKNRISSENNTNKLKRISQVSFEAEFDSEGRTHEQISLDFRKWDPYIIAGQITFIELTYFKAVKAEEFMSFKWTGLSKHIHAPAIVASTRWFNQLNFWAQRIILECSDLNKRAEMLSYLIRVIKKLVDHYNNLSSGMALMSALQVECIHRLKQTWNSISGKDKATFRRMEELYSGENNYEKLREHINSLKLPCIPYLGLYLTDLTYINVAHSKLSEFESQTKTDQINNILRTVSEFQQSEYDIVQNSTLFRYFDNQRYIEELQKIIEENNYKTSVSLEPNITDSSVVSSRQQSDYPVISSLSPQKTPPSYACKHPANTGHLQSPISPKPMQSSLLNETIKEVSEQSTNLIVKNCDNPIITAVDEPVSFANLDDNEKVNVSAAQQSVTNVCNPKVLKVQLFENFKVSDAYLEDDSVHSSLLCGAGSRKSNYRKKSDNKSIRFKRDSSSSSHQQVSSKTATLSSGSHAASIDKDVTALHSMSLLDDSYLDATLTDTCSIPVHAPDVSGQQLSRLDPCNSGITTKQKELLCSPPICRCKIKGDIVDLKPKASSNRKTEMRNLVKIAQAAETAAQFSKKIQNFYPEPLLYSENGNDNSYDESPTSEIQESVKLICQGVLSRKTCLKNNKKPRFTLWNRYWVVLIMSGNNAYFVYFENSHYRASERKDFKHKKCHVQDLSGVNIALQKPSNNSNLPESDRNISESPVDSSPNDKKNELKRFYIIDKEYGTIYKFRNSIIKRKKSVDKTDTENEQCLQSTSSCQQVLSLTVWFRHLSYCINKINRPVDDNKDLIVLNDG